MGNYKILIVEDEILIADSIKRYLINKGYHVIGIAISYEEAKELYLSEKPDLVLLDIRISGPLSGIDFARFLNTQDQLCPHIYLTSQVDDNYIESAKSTMPMGYLSKPVNKNDLYATIEISLFRRKNFTPLEQYITIKDSESTYNVKVSDILYFKSDHIYLEIHLINKNVIHTRSSINGMLEKLDDERFVHVHRSYCINKNFITSWNSSFVYLEKEKIPLSRSKKKAFLSLLNVNLENHS